MGMEATTMNVKKPCVVFPPLRAYDQSLLKARETLSQLQELLTSMPRWQEVSRAPDLPGISTIEGSP